MNTKLRKWTFSCLLIVGVAMALQFHTLASGQTSEVYYLVGEINAPGEYELKEGLTVQQAVKMAKGTNEKAMIKYTMIFRKQVSSEKRQEIEVDLDAIVRGEKEDVKVLPNDIIVVPNSKIRKMN